MRLADIYEETAKERGAEVRRFNIAEMQFDPVLHQGYEVIQELERDLLSFQEAVKWADHLVFIYPNWWSTMPAKMKGLFDRCFLPKFAFTMENGRFEGLLGGKSARVINILGSLHPFVARIIVGDYTNELKKGVLGLCGVSPVSVTAFGPSQSSPSRIRDRWMEKVR